MKKYSIALLLVFAIVLTACNPGGAWDALWGPAPAPASVAPASEPAANAPAPTVMPTPFVDLCKDQINPAWGNLITKNSLRQMIYESWKSDTIANGGSIFGASKCSVPVDSHVFGPADTVDKSGPAQLVTMYRFDSTWHPEVDVTYTLKDGCTFTPWFSQGDAPIAIYVYPGHVRMQNSVSNGVSIIGLVTCTAQ